MGNTGVGSGTLKALTTTSGNTAVGKNAGEALSGTENTLVGVMAGPNLTGDYNVAIGASAMESFLLVNSGSYNIGIGYQAIYNDNANVTGSYNIAIGASALRFLTSGANNIAIGYEAGKATFSGQTTGADNVLIGHQAGYVIRGGAGNVVVGSGAGTGLTSGSANVFLGREAGSGESTLSNQFISGASSYPMDNVWFGKGKTDATPTAWTLNGTGGSGTDISGADLNVAPGRPTGTGVPGSLVLQFAPAAAGTGSTLQTLINSLKIRGSVVPAAYTAAADTHGIDTFFRTQSGGAHSSNNPRGGDLAIQLGAAGAGGTGRIGRFQILTGPLNLDALTASTVIYLDASKNVISLANGSGVLTNNGAGVLSWGAGLSGSLVVALTDAATIAVDASLGITSSNSLYWVVLGANRNLGTPTNPTSGQEITFRFKQDGTGGRTITIPTGGAGQYRYGTDITGITLSTAIATSDYMRVRYDAQDDRWDIISFVKGY
jgi:hypothetical protein